jgi:uncharacterized damage-inducible protein DinB
MLQDAGRMPTMSLRDALLPDFDQEMAATRRVLERVPDTALDWRPHESSFDLGGLASHLAQIPRWGLSILRRDDHDLASSDDAPASRLEGVAEVLDVFDEHTRHVRAALLEAPDGALAAPWTLRRGARIVMTLPRIAAVRSFVLHHSIHHRGQLTVYLRMQNVPLPPLYGPTADEQM